MCYCTTSVSVYPRSVSIQEGEWYYGLRATVCSACTSCGGVIWRSGDSDVVSVNSSTGDLYGVSPGVATVYAAATDGSGQCDFCTVTVKAPVKVQSVEICPRSKTMYVGDTFTLDANICPSNATDQSVVWCSSDSRIATVSTYTGIVRAKKPGTVTIHATTVDGFHSSSMTLTVIIDTVTIEKDDGTFNKVVFKKSGKVWRCINHKVPYEGDLFMTKTLSQRTRYNLDVGYNIGDPAPLYVTLKEYTDEEIKLLYAIDPYGVAEYVESYAKEKFSENGLAGTLGYKDRIFELLVKREPKYFARSLTGTWYETTDKSNLSAVVSESEVIFGMHPVYDALTVIELLGFAIDIVCIIFNTSFFVSEAIQAGMEKIVKTYTRVSTTDEANVKNDLASYFVGSFIDIAIEKTKLDWACNLVTLYTNIYEIRGAFTDGPNYYHEILNYCAHDAGYDVYAKLSNGTVHKLDDICGAIDLP